MNPSGAGRGDSGAPPGVGLGAEEGLGGARGELGWHGGTGDELSVFGVETVGIGVCGAGVAEEGLGTGVAVGAEEGLGTVGEE